jgi:hypothetical protein
MAEASDNQGRHSLQTSKFASQTRMRDIQLLGGDEKMSRRAFQWTKEDKVIAF